MHDTAVRRDVVVHWTDRERLECGRVAQIERPSRRIHVMAVEIADARAAERPEITPGDGVIRRAEGAGLARPQPEIPVQAGRHFRVTFGPAEQRGVPAPAGVPRVHFAHFADRAGVQKLDRLPDADGGMSLVAHLRGNTRLARDAGDLARFADVVRERLLAIDVPARAHRPNGDDRVQVVGRRADDRVHGAFFFEQDAKVLVIGAPEIRRACRVVFLDFGARRLAAPQRAVAPARVFERFRRISDGDHLRICLLEERAHIGHPAASGADERDVHLLARWHEARAAEDVPWHDREGGNRGRGMLNEMATSGGRGDFHTLSDLLIGSSYHCSRE
jgi:hypothetical protein